MTDSQNSSGANAKPRRSLWLSLLIGLGGIVGTLIVCGALLVVYMLVVMGPQLPSLDTLTDYRPKVPLRVFTADHVLIGEFGEERRRVLPFDQIPDVMKKAVIAIEDYRFYEHGGVDFKGIARAGFEDIMHGGSAQGASTITMQVAKNFFLSSEKTYTRKIYEMLLAYKIESALSKDQILALYMNQIYLGQRAFGFASAARVYFGKDLKDVTLAQAAMLAGLPKAPSAYNPIVNPRRAKVRQEYILKRMLDLGYIDQAQYSQAIAEPIETKGPGDEFSVHAEYIAEMVRQMMYSQYKEEAYTRGLNVVTTIDSGDQESAYRAVRKGVMDYEQRHGYRGPEGFVELPANEDDREEAIEDALVDHPDNGDLIAAVVLTAGPKGVSAMRQSGETVTVGPAGLRFVAAALNPRAAQNQRIRPGSVIRLMPDAAGNWQITQTPQVEGALISMTPQDGAIRALIGGFDFNQNKFNHVTQAWRQPGSSFKPFIYSAALEKGLSPATVINDAPLYFSAAQTGGQAWEPKDDDQPEGPMSMRAALEKSKNLVSIRILQYIGTNYAQQYITRFGFDAARNPPYLPLALGAGQVTPLQMAAAYSVFANGGYHVDPYLVLEVTDSRGNVLSHAQPPQAEQGAPRVITAANDYMMNSLLTSVAQHGTGAGSNVLKRTDLAGKTGTTNEARDGWFAGYQHTLVAIAWMGYDQPRTLGSREFGAQLALPLWISYMGNALRGIPQYTMPVPEGISVLNGELYASNATPGNGFVGAIDVSDGSLPGAPDASDAVAASAAAVEPTVDASERQRILDIFGKH